MKKKTSAGFIILKMINGEYHVLSMWNQGDLDLTRGTVEPGEDIFETAKREVNEEAGITDLQMKWGNDKVVIPSVTKWEPDTLRTIYLWLAETNQSPNITPNPENDIIEHSGTSWIPLRHTSSYPYFKFFRPALAWAFDKVYGGAEQTAEKIAEDKKNLFDIIDEVVKNVIFESDEETAKKSRNIKKLSSLSKTYAKEVAKIAKKIEEDSEMIRTLKPEMVKNYFRKMIVNSWRDISKKSSEILSGYNSAIKEPQDNEK